MARRGTKKNELILSDPVSGTDVAFYYSVPTTRDHVAIAKNDGQAVDEGVLDNAIDVGLSLITGIRDGDFEREEAGEWKPVSSNPESPDYYEDWKGFLREFASDLVMAFTTHVFRGMRVGIKRGEVEGK